MNSIRGLVDEDEDEEEVEKVSWSGEPVGSKNHTHTQTHTHVWGSSWLLHGVLLGSIRYLLVGEGDSGQSEGGARARARLPQNQH